MRRAVPWIVLLAAAACGGSSYGGGSSGGGGTTGGGPTVTNVPAGFVITIAALRYSPTSLSVPPGATVTVVNNDNMPHSVTSEATAGSFVRGGVAGVSFDTGDFSTGQRTFTIPATAPAGTVIPFYCTAHLGTMATPNGTITVDPAAQPAPPAAAPAGGY